MRNAAETFGLERELMGRWENLEMRGGAGGPVRLVKGPAIIDDTVTARLQGDVSPREPLTCCHAHVRFERAKLLTVAIVDLKQDVHGFPYAVRKMLNL